MVVCGLLPHAHLAVRAPEPFHYGVRAHLPHVTRMLMDGVMPHPGLNLVVAGVAGLIAAGAGQRRHALFHNGPSVFSLHPNGKYATAKEPCESRSISRRGI